MPPRLPLVQNQDVSPGTWKNKSQAYRTGNIFGLSGQTDSVSMYPYFIFYLEFPILSVSGFDSQTVLSAEHNRTGIAEHATVGDDHASK